MDSLGPIGPSLAGRHHAAVSPGAPVPWSEEPRSLDVRVSGAGRDMDLDQVLALTSTTALVVVVDGTLVHERYFGRTSVEDRLLGYSATKSVLAMLTGVAFSRGELPD